MYKASSESSTSLSITSVHTHGVTVCSSHLMLEVLTSLAPFTQYDFKAYWKPPWSVQKLNRFSCLSIRSFGEIVVEYVSDCSLWNFYQSHQTLHLGTPYVLFQRIWPFLIGFNCLNCLMPIFVLLIQSSCLSILDYSVTWIYLKQQMFPIQNNSTEGRGNEQIASTGSCSVSWLVHFFKEL